VYGSATRGFDGFALMAREIEAIGCVLNSHRNADAWSFVHGSIIPIANCRVRKMTVSTGKL